MNSFFSCAKAKEALNSTELDHHRLRIDYSVTKRAHTPSEFNLQIFSQFLSDIIAPGIYMGVRTAPYHRSNGHSYRRSPSPDRKSSHRRHRHRYTRSRLVY